MTFADWLIITAMIAAFVMLIAYDRSL